MTLIQRLTASPVGFLASGGLLAIIDSLAPHDADWDSDRRWVCGACTKVGIGYDALASALQVAGHLRPSHGGHQYRVALVELLAVGGATVESVVLGAGNDTAYLEGLARHK